MPDAPDRRWDGTEATTADTPRRWDGAEATSAGTPGRWDGAEATSAGAPARWDGAEATQAGSRRQVAQPPPPEDDGWHRQGQSGPLTGQVFADYEIGTVLGEGGMGTVYRARQRSLGRRVAVKTLASAIGNEPLQRARFEIEARAASLIQSPHVVAVYAAGSWDGTAYFVMEYVEGSDLGSLIAAAGGKGLGHQRALELATQAARGLAAAGAKGIVHRDIKPANLLLTADGMLKIADFGISKIAGDHNLTRTGTAVGTPSYLSPEQGRGEPTDQRSDLYSLGCVLYEVLTGRKPFVGDNADAVIYQHNYAEPELPRAIDPTIPEPLQAVVVKLLQKDPTRRHTGAEALLADLDAIRAGDISVTALLQARYGTGAEEQMRRRLGRRHRWALPLAAALVLVALAVGALLWRQSTAETRDLARRQEEQLRLRLRDALDRIQPPPAGVADDLANLATLVAAADADLRRWQGKLARLQQLEARLARLHGERLPEAALRAEAVEDLAALALLVGGGSPAAVRAEARLAETQAEILRLRQQLAGLDAGADTTLAERERQQPALAALAALVGGDDPDLLRWRRRITALDERVAQLRAGLAALDAEAVADEPALDRATEALDELARCRGAAPPDADELRWRGRLATERAGIARLRDRLARLDGDGRLDEATLARLEPDLAAYAGRVLPDEAARLRWEARHESARRLVADLRARLALLDRAAELPRARLDEARAALAELRPLAAVDDAELERRARDLDTAEAALAGWTSEVAAVATEGALPLAVQERAAAALAELRRRQAVDDPTARRASERLAAEARALAELRGRCLAADDPATRVSAALADDILAYGRLLGDEDADYRRWRARIVDFIELRRRLAPLDRAEALPDTVDADLAALAALMRGDDPILAAWRSKVTRVRALAALLAALDQPQPVPAGAEAAVDELHQLVGSFPQEPAWRAKLGRVRRLEAACADRLSDTRVLLPAEAPALLAELEAETGATTDLARWTARAAELAGPPRPSWATAFTRDDTGTRAVLALPGTPTIELAFRFIPTGAFAIGSPPDEANRERDEIAVPVRLTRGRWLAETEVTQAAYERLAGANPSLQRGPELPVHRVTWYDAVAWCAALSERLGVPARLPTEAEWEHAARAGGHDPAFIAGRREALDRAAWYRATSDDGCHPVGRRPPNALGLHDLLGNVWEWCHDRYGLYPATGATDPQGGEQDGRVVRGGCWADPAPILRVANRASLAPNTASVQVGFRVLIEGR